jgi:hypothetical protein
LSRRTALFVTGILTVAIWGILVVLDLRMRDAGGPGIVGFELAGTEDRAAEILADWGDSGTDAAKASLWIDYAYILAYTSFLVLAAMATRDLADRRGWTRMAGFGRIVPVLAVGAGAFDAIENLWLLLAVNEHGGALAPRLGQVSAIAKFTLSGITVVYLLTGLLLRLRFRSSGDRSARPDPDR